MNNEIANLSTYLIIIGLIILAVEIAILGFSTFVLTFFGLALLITGLLITMEGISPTVMSAMASVAVLSGLLAVLLWKPLKSLQNQIEPGLPKSDLVGYQFYLQNDVSNAEPGEENYSGIKWKVTSDVPITKGTLVETVEVNVGHWKVKAVENTEDA